VKTSIIKFIDTFLGKPLCFLLGHIDYLFGLTPKNPTMPNIRKVLIIRPGGLGDFIYLLPALSILKKHYPGIQLDILAEKRNASAAILSNSIDNILYYDQNPLSVLFQLLQGKYDIVIDSEQFHNFSSILAYFSKAKVRIGFKSNPLRNQLYTHLIDYSLTGQEAEQFLRLLSPLGINTKEFKNEFELIKQKINSTNLPASLKPGPAYYVVAPKAGDRYRFWAIHKYQEVIDHLLKDSGSQVVIVGGKNEAQMFSKFTTNPRIINLCGKTSLLELCQILIGCKLFIGCDSGVSVLASALAVNSVLIFGATDERKWTTSGQNIIVVRKKLPCSPCYILGSHKLCKNIECMAAVTPKAVIQAFKNWQHCNEEALL